MMMSFLFFLSKWKLSFDIPMGVWFIPENPGLDWRGWFVILLLCVILFILIREIFPPDLTLLIGGTIPVILGIVPSKLFLKSFANETIVTIAMLCIVVKAFENTGLVGIIAKKFLPEIGKRLKQMFYIFPPLSFVSAFLNNTPLVMMWTPILRSWAQKRGLSPSKFLIPLSYATILGGACTLIGTSTNLVVNGLLQAETSILTLQFFEIGKIGLPIAIVGLIYLIFFSHYLLPERPDVEVSLSKEMRKITSEFFVEKDSSFINLSVEEIGKKFLKGEFSILEIEREGKKIDAPGPREVILENDRLVFVGDVSQIERLHAIKGLKSIADPKFRLEESSSHYSEFVIPIDSTFVSKTLRQLKFRERYGGSVFAIYREGRPVSGKIGSVVLKPGDILMVFSPKPWDEIDQRAFESRNFYVLKPSIQLPIFSPQRTLFVLIVIIGMVVAATLGVSMMIASLAAALIFIVTRLISPRVVIKSINWNILVLIAGGFALASALEVTKVAHFLGGLLFPILGNNPYMIVGGIFLLTTIVTELITNTAAVLIVFPIALQDLELGGMTTSTSMKAVGITIAIAGSCSFLTPIGYQTNTIVYGPGGYRFTDYFKVGVPLTLITWGLCIWLIPILWPMTV